MPNYPADEIFTAPETVKRIADAGHTPFYLYDQQGIIRSINELHEAFSWNYGFQNYFPLRENINPHLLQILCWAGTGVCVTSRAELELACRCGFRGDQLLYEPTRRDHAAENLAFEKEAVWLFDSEALVPDHLPKHILLRFNPCDLPMPAQLKQTVIRSKNGFNKSQLFSMIRSLAPQTDTQIGLSLQISSYSIHSGFWKRKASILFQLLCDIYDQTGYRIRSCHIGEGPGLAYHPRVTAPDLAKETELVHTAWLQLPEDLRPQMIAGVSSRIMESHGIMVTKILEQRAIFRTFLILDAGICQYSRPVIKQAYRHVSVLSRSEIQDRKLYSLVGDLPDAFDRLVLKGRMLPKVSPGEYCVVHDVGCGGRNMPLLYGLRPLPAEYLLEPDGSVRQISPHRSEAEVLDFLTAW